MLGLQVPDACLALRDFNLDVLKEYPLTSLEISTVVKMIADILVEGKGKDT